MDAVLQSIPLLIQLYAQFYKNIDFEKTMIELDSQNHLPPIKTYDFIIVGGGSAGCVLAGRLSEFFDVLLLEAGGTPPPATRIRAFTPAVINDYDTNYLFASVPQTNASLANGGVVASPTGLMLGGSGSHNQMIHNRGSPKDYDHWANILNDDSFSYMNVLKYFTRMESFHGVRFGPEEDGIESFYGHDGPIQVYSRNFSLLTPWFAAGRELGYQTYDPNGFQREGFTVFNRAERDGIIRSSSYVEYVQLHEDSRSNLTVIRYANVSEILLDDNNRALGVAYTRHGSFPQIAHARKEVILSAGAYSSPLLLMKSGIGPESILNNAEIPVKVPLEAVGKNLIEHPQFIIGNFQLNDSSILIGSEAAKCLIVSSKAEAGWPDLLIMVNPFINTEGSDQGIFLRSVIGRPRSIGHITLNTEKYKAGVRDDVELALIDFKFLTHPDDVDVMLEGVRFIFKIADTNVFKNFNISYPDPDPLCSNFTYFSDEYWKCRAFQRTTTYFHPVGTCSMGADSANSTTSVVDTKFRVRGVSNLRIVDASVMPTITNVNTNAAVMVLAEKAADDIINFYVTTPSTTSKNQPTMLTNIIFLAVTFSLVIKSY